MVDTRERIFEFAFDGFAFIFELFDGETLTVQAVDAASQALAFLFEFADLFGHLQIFGGERFFLPLQSLITFQQEPDAFFEFGSGSHGSRPDDGVEGFFHTSNDAVHIGLDFLTGEGAVGSLESETEAKAAFVFAYSFPFVHIKEVE